MPDDTDCLVDIENIIVSKKLLYSRPNDIKYAKYFKLFKDNGYIDKPILVIRDNTYENSPFVILKDQYIRYCICKNNGVTQVPIKFLKE